MSKHRASKGHRSGQPDQTPILRLWQKFAYLSRVKAEMAVDNSGAEVVSKWQVSDDRLANIFFGPIEREQARLVALAAKTPAQSTDDVTLKARMLRQCLDDEPAERTAELARSLVDDILKAC